jgi:hypothetical protein
MPERKDGPRGLSDDRHSGAAKPPVAPASKDARKKDREARLADALRANIARRKAARKEQG